MNPARPALLAALAAVLPLSSALAQGRVQTPAIPCREAGRIVAQAGAAVLGTGGATYDRFVRDRGFCAVGEITEAAFVPAADTPQCLVGYRCRQRAPVNNR
jgi:hypothetical protein